MTELTQASELGPHEDIEKLKAYNLELCRAIACALMDVSDILNPSTKNYCKYCCASPSDCTSSPCPFLEGNCSQYADYKGAIIKQGNKFSKFSSTKYDLDVRLLYIEGRRLSTIYDALVDDITQILSLSPKPDDTDLCMFCEYVSECESKRDSETCKPRWRYSKLITT